MRPNNSRDSGSAILAVVATLAITAVILTGLIRTAGVTIDAARARTAADASALAGAASDEAAARRVAVLNGGRLESYLESAEGVTVVVSVGTATATARAS